MSNAKTKIIRKRNFETIKYEYSGFGEAPAKCDFVKELDFVVSENKWNCSEIAETRIYYNLRGQDCEDSYAQTTKIWRLSTSNDITIEHGTSRRDKANSPQFRESLEKLKKFLVSRETRKSYKDRNAQK